MTEEYNRLTAGFADVSPFTCPYYLKNKFDFLRKT
jgi:hypothetical protein